MVPQLPRNLDSVPYPLVRVPQLPLDTTPANSSNAHGGHVEQQSEQRSGRGTGAQ